MEFNFIIRKDFSVDNEGFLIIEGNKLTSSLAPSIFSSNLNKKYVDSPITEKTTKLAEILNRMGEASAKVYIIIHLLFFIEIIWKSYNKFHFHNVGARSSDSYYLL